MKNTTQLFIYPEYPIEITSDFANGWGNWVPDLASKYVRTENGEVMLNVNQNLNILTYPTTLFENGKTYRLTYRVSEALTNATHFITIDNSNSVVNVGNGTFTTTIKNVKTNINNLRVVLQNNCHKYQKLSNISAVEYDEREIELYDNETIPLNLSIADVSDFSKRDTGYSKTINIPGTALNNILFKNCFKVQADNTFPLNYPIKSKLFQKSLQIFEGSLFLNSINLNNEDRNIEYRADLRSAVNTLFKITSERYLRNGLPEERTEYFYDNAWATWTYHTYIGFLNPSYPTGFKVGEIIRIKQNPGATNPGYDGVWTIKAINRVVVGGITYDNVETDCPYISDTPPNGGTITRVISVDTTVPINEDLDFSEYNHSLTRERVVKSWYKGSTIKSGTANAPTPSGNNDVLGKGYVYPLIDYGFNNTDLKINDLKPSLFIKEILDKIFKQANFTYTSTFLNSEFFKRLLYLNTTEFITEYTVTEAQQRTSYSSNQTALNDLYNGTQTIFHKVGSPGIQNSQLITVPLWNTDGVNGTVPINFDASYAITCDIDTNKIKFLLSRGEKGGGSDDNKVDIKDTGDLPTGDNRVGCVRFDLIHTKANGTNIVLGTKLLNIQNIASKNTYPQYPSSKVFNTRDTGTVSFPAMSNYIMSTGDKVWVSVSMSSRPYASGSPVKWNYRADRTIGLKDMNFNVGYTVNANCVVLNIVGNTNGSVMENDIVRLNNCLHKGVKQSDFILSLVKMFNLYIDIDPLNKNNLLIEPYDAFTSTSGATEINWSQKRDFDKDFLIEQASDALRKNIKFSYLPDTDELNSSFSLNNSSKIYGERTILSEVKTTEEYDVTKGIIFAPTIIDDFVGKTDKIIAPAIRKIGVKPSGATYKPRICYWGGIQYWDNNATTQWSIRDISGVVQYSYYPYAGHVDKPLRGEDTLDLNFGVMPKYYWSIGGQSITKNNLVEAYYKNMLTELTDESSRKVTAWIWLNEKDISEFSFKNTYVIDGVHYRCNKIIDYTSGDKVTKVELLKLFKNSLQVTATKSNRWDRWNWGEINIKDTYYRGDFYDATWHNEINTDWYPQRNDWVNGTNNYVGFRANSIGIVGDNNIVGADTSNIQITNSNNVYIQNGLSNVSVLNTDNLLVTESDVSYINGQKFKDGIIQKKIDLITGGVDELQYMYSSSNINLLKGGEDILRDFGSADFGNPNYISGGERLIYTKSLYE